MLILMALVLLATTVLLLLHPHGMLIEALRDGANGHPGAAVGVATAIAIAIVVAGTGAGRRSGEADAQGYAELWYMAQTSPVARQRAREDLADGKLSRSELGEMRTLYRRTTDTKTMRDGVLRELARQD